MLRNLPAIILASLSLVARRESLSETKFDSESVRTVTTNFAVNSNQLHIVEINNGSIKEISSCQ